MNIFKNVALIGLSTAFFFACSSKDKDADTTVAAAEDVASEDIDEPDTESAKTAGVADPADDATTGSVNGDLKTRRAEARRAKIADGTQGNRDRRAERLAMRGAEGGEAGEVDPKASGPRSIKPGGSFAKPDLRPAAVKAEAPQEAVAVAPGGESEETAEAPEGATPELAAANPAVAAKAPVDIAPLGAAASQGVAVQIDRVMPLATVSELLGKPSLRDKGMLPGIAAAGGYSSAYYDLDAKSYGVGLQIWRDLTPRETEDRFRRVRLQHPNADDVQSLKPLKSFYAGYFGIQSLTFARPDKMLVVTLSCGEGLCDHAALLKLAQAVQNRL